MGFTMFTGQVYVENNCIPLQRHLAAASSKYCFQFSVDNLPLNSYILDTAFSGNYIVSSPQRDMNKCILMYKCLNKLAKCYLTDWFQTNNNIHQFRTHQTIYM